jgi:hypothetical protein
MYNCAETSLNHSSTSVVAPGSGGSNRTHSVFASTTVDGSKSSFTTPSQLSRSHSPMAAIRWVLCTEQFCHMTDDWTLG